jgi:hypothetical protein
VVQPLQRGLSLDGEVRGHLQVGVERVRAGLRARSGDVGEVVDLDDGAVLVAQHLRDLGDAFGRTGHQHIGRHEASSPRTSSSRRHRHPSAIIINGGGVARRANPATLGPPRASPATS